MLILQGNGPFPRQRHQNLNYIYIIITIAIYLSIYLYLYKYTLKSVTALAPNTEEKYWRCCWIQVVALTEVLWRVSTTRKGTTRLWELKCCCPNIAIINKNKELGGVNEGRWGQAEFWPCWRQKKQFSQKKNYWGLHRVADGEIETRVWSFQGHVDFASSYVALWTLFNSFPKFKRSHCAMFNTPALMEEKQDWTLGII